MKILIYLASFILATTAALPAYVESSFLQSIVGAKSVGSVFAISSLLTIIIFSSLSSRLRRFGLRAPIILFTFLAVFATIQLSTSSVGYATLFAFVVFYSAGMILRYLLDVLLEQYSDDTDTGMTRGIYMTAFNLAWLASPFLAGRLLEINPGHYDLIFFLTLPALLLVLLLTIFALKEKDRAEFKISTPWQALKRLWSSNKQADTDLKKILIIDFLLHFFYAIMVVYSPIYLREVVGLSWQGIGIIFTFMLLPFVLFEAPLGRLADKYFGEKEMLISGLIIMIFTTAAIPLIGGTSLIAWSLILFLTRTGAATTEIMKETYLFKKIDSENADIVAVSRNNIPLAYLIGPVFGMIFTIILPLSWIFPSLALILVSGIWFAWNLKDTR
ncbi:MAG: MFS transporter [Candidatus Paceibacterota bacterium]|jgi:MFS family permease